VKPATFGVCLLALLVGCSEHPLIGILEADLTPECIESIAQADEFWADKLDVDHVFELRETDKTDIKPDYREVTFGSFTHKKYVGLARSEKDASRRVYSGRVLFNDGKCTVGVAAHEMGHILGLHDRRDDRESLMYYIALGERHGGGFKLTPDELGVARKAIAPL